MEQTGNTFMGGLNKDFNPIATPNDVLTDALNATLITFNGNELMLQNDMGNTNLTYYPRTYDAITSENNNDIDYKETVSKIREKVKLKEGYIPIGIKEHGDIIYIVSYNPEEKRTEIGSFPGPEYRPIDKIPSKEINKDIVIKEDTLSKIYNLTEEGETLLKPYDLISDYSMEGLSPMFISTPTNKGLYIPKYINVNTNQDITDTINITYTYKTKHQWFNGDNLMLYNYKISKELFNYINGTLDYNYDYEYDLNNLKNTSVLLKPKIYQYQIKTTLQDKTITETITEEYYPIFTEYTYKNEDLILLQTYYDLFNDSNLEQYMSNCKQNNLESLTNDPNSFNPFISYPNIKKGDIGVSYTIEDIEGIMYTNKESKEFSYKTYIPEVSYVDNLVYENVVIQNSSFKNYKPLYYKSNLFGGATYVSTSLKLNDDSCINIKNSQILKTQGYYLYNYNVDEKKNITYEMLLYNSNDYIYLTEDEYNVLDDKYKTEWSDGSNNYEIIEKVITLNINGINVQVPALLYRKTN